MIPNETPNNGQINNPSNTNPNTQVNLSNPVENQSLSNNKNPAIFNTNDSSQIMNFQRRLSVAPISSPSIQPPAASRDQKQILQRRKSAPAWSASREVKYIKKDRRKKNVEQMLVVFQDDKNDIGRWIDTSELNCPQLIEEYWIRKKQMKESQLNNPNGEEKQSSKKTGARSLKEIVGMIPSPEYKYIFVVSFNDSVADEYIVWREMRKHFPKQLLKYYESHIDQENFIIAPPSSFPPQIVIQENKQVQHHHHHEQHPQEIHIQQPPPQPSQPQPPQPQPGVHVHEEVETEPEQIVEQNTHVDPIVENESKPENSENSLPTFLMNSQNNLNIQNSSAQHIHMLQRQVQLQRMTNTPPHIEPSRPNKPPAFSQFIQQNLMMMNRK